MNTLGRWARLVILSGTVVSAFAETTLAQEKTATKPRTVARLFWQDSDANKVRWGNLVKADEWSVKATDIAAFPDLNNEECSLVQMEESEGVVLIGVHDEQNGEVQSGWIAIDSGVEQEPHGDHFHWKYTKEPRVQASRLDTKQGNPAHVYVYDGRFYVANDKKDGFTVVDPVAIREGKPADRFYSGGGGHITLAAVENKVCYSTWIDRDGDNKGRVDVVPIRAEAAVVATGAAKLNGYSLYLPSGGIHGATANSGRVFFAPADGICWVDADTSVNKLASTVAVNHISLGKDSADKPLRTGAFANHRNWVLFSTGAGEQSQLCVVDAKASSPYVARFQLGLAEGTSATTPIAADFAGKQYAFVFQESKEGSKPEKLLIIRIDANGDGNPQDMVLEKSIDVGPSKIVGHGGHHELAFTSSRRLAIVTNPGDGTVMVISLSDLTTVSKLKVGGTPSRLIVVGG